VGANKNARFRHHLKGEERAERARRKQEEKRQRSKSRLLRRLRRKGNSPAESSPSQAEGAVLERQ
jgi:hypothetical protein